MKDYKINFEDQFPIFANYLKLFKLSIEDINDNDLTVKNVSHFCIEKEKVRNIIKREAKVWDWTIEEVNSLLIALGVENDNSSNKHKC